MHLIDFKCEFFFKQQQLRIYELLETNSSITNDTVTKQFKHFSLIYTTAHS